MNRGLRTDAEDKKSSASADFFYDFFYDHNLLGKVAPPIYRFISSIVNRAVTVAGKTVDRGFLPPIRRLGIRIQYVQYGQYGQYGQDGVFLDVARSRSDARPDFRSGRAKRISGPVRYSQEQSLDS
eukprot:1181112-Prorocentrum_minimum.AAC.1